MPYGAHLAVNLLPPLQRFRVSELHACANTLGPSDLSDGTDRLYHTPAVMQGRAGTTSALASAASGAWARAISLSPSSSSSSSAAPASAMSLSRLHIGCRSAGGALLRAGCRSAGGASLLRLGCSSSAAWRLVVPAAAGQGPAPEPPGAPPATNRLTGRDSWPGLGAFHSDRCPVALSAAAAQGAALGAPSAPSVAIAGVAPLHEGCATGEPNPPALAALTAARATRRDGVGETKPFCGLVAAARPVPGTSCKRIRHDGRYNGRLPVLN